MQEKVEILIEGQDPINVELLSEFEINDNGAVKKFILLTNNDIDQNGLIKILASEIDGGVIKKIESEEDWAKVKNIMRSIIAASPEAITYINTSENKSFNAEPNYARVIAVQDSAKQAIAKDYFEKRPEVEKEESIEVPVIEDPNINIYPTDNTVAPIGSEILNGISETPEVTQEEVVPPVDLPVVDDEEPIDNYDDLEDNAAAAVETNVEPSVAVDNNVDQYREELIKDITAAVDKFIENTKLANENKELKALIERLESKLNS